MPNLPIQFQDKINSPELLAFLQQFGKETYVDAELINKFRDGINELYYSLNPDRIISLGTETIDGNEYTYEGYTWQLGGVQVNNIGNPSIIVIPSATVGFKRKDISVFTPTGTIERVAGTETDGEVVTSPDVPEGTLYYKSYDIYGDTIEVAPEPPAIDGSIYKKKIENTRYKSRLSGENVIIPFQAAGQSHYSVTSAALVSVAGFTTAGLTTPMYEGQDVIFENQTGHDIALKDSFGVDTSFVIGDDLIVPNEGKIWFRFRNNELELIMKSWSEVDLSTKADLVAGKVPASQLPSYVDDVLEFANLASFPVTGETGKIYVALDTNFTYRWSGSAYVQVGGGGTPVFSDTPLVIHTGTRVNTLLSTITIPANTIKDGDVWTVEIVAKRLDTNSSASAFVYFDFNNPYNVNGPIRGENIGGAARRRVRIQRSFLFKNGAFHCFSNSGTFYTDFSSMQFENSIAINLAINNTIYTSISLNAPTDIAVLDYVIFKKIN